MNIVTEKKCRKCGKIKSIIDFYAPKSLGNKPTNSCKECQRQYASQWNKINKGRYNENARLFRRRHPDRVRDSNREYYINHQSEFHENGNKWANENREKVRESNRKYKKKASIP